MRRAWIGLLAALAAALVASQLALPPYLEGRIADRLTERGGSADVSLSALPGLRLLAGDGDRIEVAGSGLRVELAGERPALFEKLDGFGAVDVRLADVRAGPFDTRSFRLARPGGSRAYRLTVSATTSLRELSAYAGSRLAGPLGGAAGRLAGEALPLARRPLPLELDVEIESRDGRPRIVSGAGSVAGLPAGPLAEAIAGAIVARL